MQSELHRPCASRRAVNAAAAAAAARCVIRLPACHGRAALPVRLLPETAVQSMQSELHWRCASRRAVNTAAAAAAARCVSRLPACPARFVIRLPACHRRAALPVRLLPESAVQSKQREPHRRCASRRAVNAAAAAAARFVIRLPVCHRRAAAARFVIRLPACHSTSCTASPLAASDGSPIKAERAASAVR